MAGGHASYDVSRPWQVGRRYPAGRDGQASVSRPPLGHGSVSQPPLGQAAVRRACLAALIMLVVQYGLGIIVNLYVAITPDSHSGMLHEIASAPLALTVHALLGLALIGNALMLLARALRLGDRLIVGLVTAALGALAGAFAGGEVFVRNGSSGASLAMALLTGVALLCYVAVLAQVSASRRDGRHSLRSRVPGHRAAGIRYETSENLDVAAPWSQSETDEVTSWPPGESWSLGESWSPGESWRSGESWSPGESWSSGESWAEGAEWAENAPWDDAEAPDAPLPDTAPPAAWPTPRRPRISSALFED